MTGLFAGGVPSWGIGYGQIVSENGGIGEQPRNRIAFFLDGDVPGG